MFDCNKTKSQIILDAVTFEDVKICYSVSEDVEIVFTIDPLVCASTRDWVGIYQAGWESYESCLTYKWGIGRHFNNSCRTRVLTFKADELTKAVCGIHYQFVYVSRYLEILGVSQYFQFGGSLLNVKSPSGQKSVKSVGCSVSSPDCLSNAVTSCGRCEKLFEIQKGSENNAETSDVLAKKVANLERSITNLHTPFSSNAMRWNEETEHMQLKNFLGKIYGSLKPNATGEHVERAKLSRCQNEPETMRNLLTAMDNIIEKAKWVKEELVRLMEQPTCSGEGAGEPVLIDPNVIGILPPPDGTSDIPRPGLNHSVNVMLTAETQNL